MTAPQILFCLVGLFFCYWMVVERKHVKPGRSYTSLSFDESFVIACLLQVKPTTIYGECILANLRSLEDDAKLRQVIKEVTQSTMECPEIMNKVLGDEAFHAVWEYNAQKKLVT